MLTRVALTSTDPHQAQLVSLANSVKIDAFTRVKAAIDTMVTQLLTEKKNDQTHKDFCIAEFHTNDLETQNNEQQQETTGAKLTEEKDAMAKAQEQVQSLSSQIADLQAALKEAGENREKANSLFRQTLADQEKAKTLLVEAKNALDTSTVELIQRDPMRSAPAGFGAYEKIDGGAVAALTQVIGMVDMMTAEIRKEEANAQSTYEKFVQDTNKALEVNSASLNTQKEELATSEYSITNLETQLAGEKSAGRQLQNMAGDLHTNCDFVLKNFDTRSQAYENEIEALRQAKAVLSGAQFE